MAAVTALLLALLSGLQPAQAQSPGRVTTNLQLWLRADAGASGALWQDQSTNGADATQADANRQPSVTSNALNFNPAVTFSGDNSNTTGDVLSIASITLDQTASIFVVNTRPPQNAGTDTTFRSVFGAGLSAALPSDGYFVGYGRDNLASRAAGPRSFASARHG